MHCPMRAPLPSIHRAVGLVVIITFLGRAAANAASAGKTNAPAAKAATEAATPAPAETPIPRSVFVIPKSAKEGRDPFFPNSTRLFGEVTTKTNTTAPVTKVDLVLKALAVSAEQRLATINTRTFEVGEEAEIQTGAGRVRVRCLEIHEDSVVIEVGGERRTLRMRAKVLAEP